MNYTLTKKVYLEKTLYLKYNIYNLKCTILITTLLLICHIVYYII